MKTAAESELKEYRNLCLNPFDYRLACEVVDPDAPEWSNPTDSKAIELGEVKAYPHAYANRVTRNEGLFLREKRDRRDQYPGWTRRLSVSFLGRSRP